MKPREDTLQHAARAAPVLWALSGITLGILVADTAEICRAAAAAALVLALVGLLLAWRKSRGLFLAATLTFGCLAALRAATLHDMPHLDAPCGLEESRWRVRVAGATSRDIAAATGRLQRVARLELLAQECGGTWIPSGGAVRGYLWGGPTIARGDVLELRLRLEGVMPRRNPTDPDPLLLARRDDVQGRATALSPYAFRERASGIAAAIDRARDRAAARIEARLDTDTAAVAKALATGDQTAIGQTERQKWADSGLAHILSVSGLHVTLVAALVYGLLYFLLASVPGLAERLSLRRTAAALAIPAVVGFCLWAGAPAAAVRATIMAVAFLGGLLIMRPHAVLNALGIAGAAILLAAPASLYDPGFLLSFVAVLALLFAPRAPQAASRLARLGRAVVGLVLTSIVATAATAPILATYFGRLSLVAPVANVIGVPLASIVATPLALIYVVASAVGGLAETIAASLLELSLRGLAVVVSVAASIPYAAIDVPRPRAIELAGYLLFILPLVAPALVRRWRRGRTLALLSGALLLGAGVAARVYERAHRDGLTVMLPYVGQGDATLVLLPEGGTMLVDAGGAFEPGGYDPGARVLAPMLRREGIHTIDLAVVTHPHPDHLEGFGYLMDHFAIRELWWNGDPGELPTMAKLLAHVRAEGGSVRVPAELPRRLEREGVTIEVLHPRSEDSAAGLYPGFHGNDNSLALRLEYGQRSILLAADIEQRAEAILAPSLKPADILKAPHHGSKSSSTAPLLVALAPRLVLLCVGDHNRFNFPDADVLRRYATAKAEVARTDVDGCLTLTTDGGSWEVRGERGRRLGIP